ncbi:hypothetical protein ACROYT_G014197 [Oculina patagonica]
MEAVIKTQDGESKNLVEDNSLPKKKDKDYVIQNHPKTQASSVTSGSNSTMETDLKTMDRSRKGLPSEKGIPSVKEEPLRKSIKYLKVLDDPDNNQMMVHKLPCYLIDRWSCKVDRWLNKEEEDQHHDKGTVLSYPILSVFCCFLQKESRIACNPTTTVRPQKGEVVKEDPDKGRKSNSFNRRKPPKLNVFVTDSHEVADSNAGNNRQEKEAGNYSLFSL